jgi:hypothetical protein
MVRYGCQEVNQRIEFEPKERLQRFSRVTLFAAHALSSFRQAVAKITI